MSVKRTESHADYALKVQKQGVPNRLQIDSSFGYWFSGFFDGEGCLIIHKSRDGRRHSGVQIALRYDDLPVLEKIQRRLGGTITRNQAKNSPSLLKYAWRITNTKDLAEIMIPLFDYYPLSTKKSKEYLYWREYILSMYHALKGGGNPKCLQSLPNRMEFDSRMEYLIKKVEVIRFPEGKM